MATTQSGLASASPMYTSSSFNVRGGMLGFLAANGDTSVGDITIQSYNSSTSSWVNEAVEDFAINSTVSGGAGYVRTTPIYDADGNMTYDGSLAYTYDAWNRLVAAAHAYRETGSSYANDGTLHVGQTFATYTYDGRGRRIKKAITNTGTWDCTYNEYYAGKRLVEEHNGSGNTIRQFVWGQGYVDELVLATQVHQSGGTDVYTNYYAMQDANWNVIAVASASGGLPVEEYQYTPYGERTVYFSAGTNDPNCTASSAFGRRATYSGVTEPYSICPFGHQGLAHDEEDGLIYNRARYFSQSLNSLWVVIIRSTIVLISMSQRSVTPNDSSIRSEKRRS